MPLLAYEQAADDLSLLEEAPARPGEGCVVVGKLAHVELGEQGEGEIQGADERTGEGAAVEIRWDCELGDDPDGIGGSVTAKAGGERFNFRLSEAVEEEV